MESFNIRVVEAMEIPKDYEAKFLRDIADKLGLQFPSDRIFTERLSEDKLESDWGKIVESLQLAVTEKSARQHYWSREICPKLKEWGFTYEPAAKKLWLSARQWLAQTQFEPWLWEQLVEKSQPTQQMGVKLPENPAELGMLPRNNDYLMRVTVNSPVIFEIQLRQSAHLTLLEREPNGTVVCLCPSPFAQKSHFRLEKATTIVLPQPSAPQPVFVLTGTGTEQLIALLTPQTPLFNWLDSSRWEAKQLQVPQLQEMFEYVNRTPEARLLYTEYEVV